MQSLVALADEIRVTYTFSAMSAQLFPVTNRRTGSVMIIMESRPTVADVLNLQHSVLINGKREPRKFSVFYFQFCVWL